MMWSSQSASSSVRLMAKGRTMFSCTDMDGNRLNDWKTKPTRFRRMTAASFSERLETQRSPMKARPAVSRSKPAAQCNRVDLPEPDGPIMAVKEPAANSTVTPRRACTAASPTPYCLYASTLRAPGLCDVLMPRYPRPILAQILVILFSAFFALAFDGCFPTIAPAHSLA